MKQPLNPDELYKAAIQLEQKAQNDKDIPIKLTKSRAISLPTISKILTAAAAIFILGWIIIQPRIEHRKMEKLHAKVEQFATPPGFINHEGTLKPVVRFNSSIKSFSKSNETIQRFNRKVNKINKTNT